MRASFDQSFAAAHDAADVVRDAYESWAGWDLEGVLATLHPDIDYTLHLDPAVVPLAGRHVGKQAMRELLRSLRQTFSYLRFIPSSFTARGDQVRHRVVFSLRHIQSGAILSSSMVVVSEVRDGLITRLDEYPDAPLVEAFFKMQSGGMLAATVNPLPRRRRQPRHIA